MHTSFLVLIILALVIVASIITSIVTYLILAGRNKRIRLTEQYRQIGITDGYLSIQEEIEKNIKSEHIKFTTVSPVKAPDFADEEHTEQESDQKISGLLSGEKIVIPPKRSLNTGILYIRIPDGSVKNVRKKLAKNTSFFSYLSSCSFL